MGNSLPRFETRNDKQPKELEYISWSGNCKAPYGRAIAAQKSKAAFKGHSLRVFKKGQGFPQSSVGQDVPQVEQNNLPSFGRSFAAAFFPATWALEQPAQAMAASK